MIKACVIGAAGQLGSDLVRVLEEDPRYHVFALGHKDIECTDRDSVRAVLLTIRPNVVVNCAAFVRVDECEVRVEDAFLVNAIGALHVARSAAEIDAVCVYISTDYVFDGKKKEPYEEEDTPSPLNVYGVSKLAGEHFVRDFAPRHYIIRTSGLYGAAGSRSKGGNFVETMIRLAREQRHIRVVDDQIMTPTYTEDLARRIEQLVRSGTLGAYHITNSGQCSWFEFAQTIFEFLDLKPDLEPTTTVRFGAKANRPRYSVLAPANARRLGLEDLRPWPEALYAYLRQQGYAAAPVPI